MDKNPGQEDHIRWLREQVVENEAALRRAERDLEEAQKKVDQLQKTASYFRGVIHAVCGNKPESIQINLEDSANTDGIDGSASSRTIVAKDLMRPEFTGMMLKEAAKLVLNKEARKMHTDEIAKIIYDIRSNEELQAARRSLSSEMRRGSVAGLWKKVGRNEFAPNSHKGVQKEVVEEDDD